MNDHRAFDAWGGIRNSDSSGDPKARHCANLGHKQDDESGLVYMRSRYYDPICSRFLSSDPSLQGKNLFECCSNNPIGRADPDGRDSWLEIQIAIMGCLYMDPADAIQALIGLAARVTALFSERMAESAQLIAEGNALLGLPPLPTTELELLNLEFADMAIAKGAQTAAQARIAAIFTFSEILIVAFIIAIDQGIDGP